jgi:hypothetical protein
VQPLRQNVDRNAAECGGDEDLALVRAELRFDGISQSLEQLSYLDFPVWS